MAQSGAGLHRPGLEMAQSGPGLHRQRKAAQDQVRVWSSEDLQQRMHGPLPFPEHCTWHQGTHRPNTFGLDFCKIQVSHSCHKTSTTAVSLALN